MIKSSKYYWIHGQDETGWRFSTKESRDAYYDTLDKSTPYTKSEIDYKEVLESQKKSREKILKEPKCLHIPHRSDAENARWVEHTLDVLGRSIFALTKFLAGEADDYHVVFNNPERYDGWIE